MTRTALTLLLCSAALAADPKLPDGAVAKVGEVRREALVISPDGKMVAVRVPKGFDLIDLATGKAVPIRDDTGKRFLPEDEIRDSGDSSLAFFPDGKTVATANQQPCVSVWDAATGKHLRDVPTPKKDDIGDGQPKDARHTANQLFGSPHLGGVVVTQYWSGVRVYLLNGKDEWALMTTSAPGRHRHATSNGRWVTAVEEQASIECYFYSLELLTEKREKGLDRGEVFQANVLNMSRYATTAVTSEDGKFVAVWSTESGREKNVHAVGLITREVTGKSAQLADAESGFGGEFWEVKELGFSSDSKRLFAATETKVAVWDTATGKRGKDVKLPAKVSRVVFDPPRDRTFVLGGGFLYVVGLK
jgi:WD40 repeat protein